jgi:TonB-dependent SusC/RagA subfamily outer membrane receptor
VAALALAAGAAACAGHARPEGSAGTLRQVAATADVRARADTADSTASAPRRRTGALDDTVTVGYGTQRRRDVTGAVGSVVFEDAADQQGPRVEQLLARVPGVQVVPRGDGSFTVRVRGSHLGGGEPLWVLDGMPVAGGAAILAMMAPREIERIDVLKDASAAIYGADARHGVIVVRTRRGP